MLKKRNLNFGKKLRLANLMSTATETISQFDVNCERNSEISRNVQELGFLQKKMGFPKKYWVFQKSLMETNLLYNAKELVRFLKTFNFWDLEIIRKTSVFEKNWSFLKRQRQQTCRRIDWNCNSPQKIQTSCFFKIKKKGFLNKNLESVKIGWR